MASHSSSLAWRSPWTEEPGRLQSMGWHRVRHNWSDLAQWLGKKKKSRPTYKEKKLMVTGWEMKGGRGLSGLFYTIIYKAIYMSILKKISPEYTLEGLILKLQTPILWPSDAKNWLIGKNPDAGKDWRQANIGHYFANKGPSSQGYGFSSDHVWSESWTVKKAERWRIDAFELWCWRRLLRVPGLQGNPTSPF